MKVSILATKINEPTHKTIAKNKANSELDIQSQNIKKMQTNTQKTVQNTYQNTVQITKIKLEKKNTFYSPSALNLIIDYDLVEDENEVVKYFDGIETSYFVG